MTGIDARDTISPALYQHIVTEPNEYRDERMDIYLKTYFNLKDLDKKENGK